MSMKLVYKGVLFLLVLVFFIWLWYLNGIYTPPIENASPPMIMPNTAQNMTQSIAAFAALFASIIALSSADPRKPKINIGRDISLEDSLAKPYLGYTINRAMPVDIFIQKTPKPKEYYLKFKLTNNSTFTLMKPAIMIQAPNILHSDIFKPCELFRDNDHIIFDELSFWNPLDSITFGVGGFIIEGETLNIKIDISCKNAEGITINERIETKQ
jgi:hypothetical protein